jgi:general secretion pathway protein M
VILLRGFAGRMMAVGLLAAIPAAIWFAAGLPLWRVYASRQSHLAETADQLRQLERIAAGRPRLAAHLAALQDASKRTVLLLPGQSDALAAADLQTLLKDILTQAGGVIGSVESLPAIQRGEFRKVAVRLVLTGDQTMLAEAFQAIGAARPRLFVDNLTIRSSAATANRIADKWPPLNITFDVYGYRLDGPRPMGRP